MSKGHADNHAARLKRGPEAFTKKKKRRAAIAATAARRCNLCGNIGRIEGGLCPLCRSAS